MCSVYRWRPAFQDGFAARLDGCVKPPEAANHPPIVRIGESSPWMVKPGVPICLDASSTSDPDGDGLGFRWTVYPPDTEAAESETIHDGETSKPHVEVGPALTGKIVPLLLTVSDTGTPALIRYGRVLLRVEATK